jgi:hypothetical protein
MRYLGPEISGCRFRARGFCRQSEVKWHFSFRARFFCRGKNSLGQYQLGCFGKRTLREDNERTLTNPDLRNTDNTMSSPNNVKKIAALVLGLIVLFVYNRYIAPALDDGGIGTQETATDTDSSTSQPSASGGVAKSSSAKGSVGDPTKSKSNKGLSQADQEILGQLKARAGGELVSTAGLRYQKGGREGHRLDHIRRHDDDLPNRDGQHGVFDGDEAKMLAIIDEAYLRVKEKHPSARIRHEGSRTVATVNLRRDIGYVGGVEGRRKGNPKVQGVKLILERDSVITAYPVPP